MYLTCLSILIISVYASVARMLMLAPSQRLFFSFFFSFLFLTVHGDIIIELHTFMPVVKVLLVSKTTTRTAGRCIFSQKFNLFQFKFYILVTHMDTVLPKMHFLTSACMCRRYLKYFWTQQRL